MEQPTELRTWLDRFGLSLSAFGAKIGTTGEHVGRIAAGKADPSMPLRLLIGYVTREHEQSLGVAAPVGVPSSSWESRELPAVANGSR